MIGEFLSEVGGRVGHGLVLAWFESYVLRLDSSLQLPGQEKHIGILFIPLYIVVREIQLSVETYVVEEIMADQAWFSALQILFCLSPGILRQPPYKAERKSEDIFVLWRFRAFSRYPFCWL